MQFSVVNRDTSCIVYEAATIGQIRGFLDACSQVDFFASRVVIDVDMRGDSICGYRACLIDDRTGQIIAVGPEIGINEIEDTIYRTRIAVLPAAVVKSLMGWERPSSEIPDDDDFLGGDDDDDAAEAWKGGSR